jgi:hypothetical protein
MQIQQKGKWSKYIKGVHYLSLILLNNNILNTTGPLAMFFCQFLQIVLLAVGTV